MTSPAAAKLRDHHTCMRDRHGACRAEVTDALADLLDAIREVDGAKAGTLVGDPHPLRRITALADALEAAILRSAT